MTIKKALAIVARVICEVRAEFGNDADCYVVDAVDHAFCKAGIECMDFQDLEEAIMQGDFEPGTLAVLAGGEIIALDTETWEVTVR